MKMNVYDLSVRDRIYVSGLMAAGLPVPSHLIREMKTAAALRTARKLKIRRARKTQSALYGNMTCFI